MTKGKISVHTDNLLPIIKKWLYSDSDIFLRELISNAQDAIMKHKKLSSLGEAQMREKYEIKVKVNKADGTLKISDNGIGMTKDEVEKYINQVAFSGAAEFIEKYENENDDKSTIIGHFGLGFYSAFMAAETVEIDTLSYTDGATAVHWLSDGGSEYEIGDGQKDDFGTEITLHIADDSKDFLEMSTVRSVLNKYCSFLPIEIYLSDESDNEKEPQLINDTNPLWLKKPSECTDEEYKTFYHKVFMDFNDPLFWIHLNVDYPFNLKGILYFPKLSHELQSIEGQIKLYNNQVFIADNIKEVTPEYLMLLKGVIDCPDLPLNVSRSFLQNDGYVSKVSGHITKKVADKLTSLYNSDKDSYFKYWDDINPFVKYGCMRDEKFYDRVKDVIVFKKHDDTYITLKDIGEFDDKEVFYITDPDGQAQYVELLKDENKNLVYLNYAIDTHFISLLEYKVSDIKFKRVDSYTGNDVDKDENLDEKIKDTFSAFYNQGKIEIKSLNSSSVPAIIVLSEEARRMEEMTKMYGNMGMMNLPKNEATLVINRTSELISQILDCKNDDVKNLICKEIVSMAKLSHNSLTGAEKNEFLDTTAEILKKLLNI